MAYTMQQLESLAREQGWSIERGQGKTVRFRNPKNHRFVTANQVLDGGQDLASTISNLRRAGLVVPTTRTKSRHAEEGIVIHDNGKVDVLPQPHVEPEPGPTADDFAAAVLMIDELADQFKMFRDHSQDFQAEVRGRLAQEPTPKAIEAVLSHFAAQLNGFESRVAALESRPAEKVDPLERFRERLK